ncbi:acyl carrier protein [Nonomuraea angiospora]|uniref:acyl carrier protein n=1 Tax=Nonomuraea angiospora TaxID=46172 RepID=UPI0029AD62B3|nr:acyl carrier protein [Nonomuraea angiospora]MDX3100848.1 acyl carrier protein [Nonomuraea angiospora]
MTASLVDKDELRKVIATTLDIDVDEVTDDAHFVQDLEVDSLMALEIAVTLEKRFQVKIDDTEMAGITSLTSTYELLCGLLAKRAGR